MLIKNARWLPHDSHETKVIPLPHWLTFLVYIPEWLEPKWHPRRVRRGIHKYYAPGQQHMSWRMQRNPHHQCTPISSARDPSRYRGDHEAHCRGGTVRGGGEVTCIIVNQTVGPDGCGSWAIYVGWGGASQEEGLTYCGRQDLPRRNSWRLAKSRNQEILAWNSCPLWDLVVPKKHRAPYLEIPLLAISLQDSPWSGKIWHVLPGAHYHMFAGSCRSIYSRPHGRCKPLHHTCKNGNNYGQGHSVSLMHPWRASLILTSFLKSVLVFLLVVGCVGFLPVQGDGKLKWDLLGVV